MTERQKQIAELSERIFRQSRMIESEAIDIYNMLDGMDVPEYIKIKAERLRAVTSHNCKLAQDLYSIHGSGDSIEKAKNC